MSFRDAPRPPAHIAAFAVALLGLLALIDIATLGGLRGFLAGEPATVRIFVLLLLFYFAQWLAYFLSVQYRPFRFQTLRVLLFQPRATAPDVDTIREKGRSVLTTQAIFTAISVFVISALYRGDGGGVPGPVFESWDSLSFHMVLTSAAVAVVFFIISADAVETTFNSFGESERRYVAYFYEISRRRKYFGFVLSVLAVILFVSRISPGVGCLAMLTLMVAGYAHWFPRAAWRPGGPDFALYLGTLIAFVAAGYALIG